MLNFKVYIRFINYCCWFLLNGLSSGVHAWLDLCGLWKKQRFSCGRGWAVWEGLSQHKLPLGLKKSGYFSISVRLLLLFPVFVISLLLCYLLSFCPSPLKHLPSMQRMSFQREKHSFFFNQKGGAVSRCSEENMKG